MKEPIKEIYPILISNISGARVLVENLTQKGFNASIYDKDWFGVEEDSQAIWVGTKIPAKYAIEAIKIAKNTFPHLCYLHLSGDHHQTLPASSYIEIFVASSTDSAKKHRIQIWEESDFDKMDLSMSLTAFHALIRSKY